MLDYNLVKRNCFCRQTSARRITITKQAECNAAFQSAKFPIHLYNDRNDRDKYETL